MRDLPDPQQIRAGIRALDATEKKVLGGMIVVMIRHHGKIKDQEWVAENFTRLAVAALGFGHEGPADEDIAAVEAFVAKSMGPVLDVAFPLFARVAADMRTRAGVAAFSLEAARARALSYFE